jgi:hypothetical protein
MSEPRDREEAVEAALLYVLQPSDREHAKWSPLLPVAFIRALEQDGYTVTTLKANFAEHGYTCGICSWGRADQPRSYADYLIHLEAAHPGVKDA